MCEPLSTSQQTSLPFTLTKPEPGTKGTQSGFHRPQDFPASAEEACLQASAALSGCGSAALLTLARGCEALPPQSKTPES